MSPYKGFKVWIARDYHRVFIKEEKQFSAWLRDAAFQLQHAVKITQKKSVSFHAVSCFL